MTAFAIGSAAGLLNLALVMTLLVLSHRGRLPAAASVPA